MDNITVSELLGRLERDQAMRQGKTDWDDTVDTDNTKFAQELIEKHGWPILSESSAEIQQAVWLIVQHADAIPEFQATVLVLMKDLPENEVNLAHVAFLEDRVRVNSRQLQLYGSQFYKDDEFFGPKPIEDIVNLDIRRKSMGLEPFAEYELKMRRMHS